MDPRPELGGGEESVCWAILLAHAYKLNRRLAYSLHGFRCQGTRLLKGKNGWILRPEIGENGWESQEEYDRYKERFLEPVRRDVISALRQL